MKTIALTVEQQILWVSQTPKSGDKATLVQDATSEIQRLLAEGQLPGGPFIAMNGACPLVVCYAIANIIGRLYQTVAVFDPKLSAYVIAINDSDPDVIGSLVKLPLQRQQESSAPVKIVLCGPPHSGKSCLLEALKSALLASHRQCQTPYPLIIDATTDGEGSWFQSLMMQNPDLARALKEKYRGSLTDAFVNTMAEAIADYALPVTLIDIGGKISAENEVMVQGATHGIILWRERLSEKEHEFYAPVAEWEAFCDRQGLQVIGKIESRLLAPEAGDVQCDPIVEGVIHGLKRGVDQSADPCVRALTQKILQCIEQRES